MSTREKPTWDEYFFSIVDVVAMRASCDRGMSGCVIVKDNRILSTGYVGAPSGFQDCYEAGHLLREVIYEDGVKRKHCVRTIHAEQNAIAYAARFGVSIQGATVYCTMQPCYSCAMLLVASGVKKVLAKHPYKVGDSSSIFRQAGVELVLLEDKSLQYD